MLKKYVKNPKMIFFILGVPLWILIIIFISFWAIKNFIIDFSFRDICPDYHSFQEAYIVDSNGKGVDSVAVVMRDFTGMNILYKTFTDSTGKFTLFNDFLSFALYNAPQTFELYVFTQNYSDTIFYQFVKYNVCHFKKVEGPDTIVINETGNGNFVLDIKEEKTVDIKSHSDYLPWNELLLKSNLPIGFSKSLDGWQDVFYGKIHIGNEALLCAVMRVPDADKTSKQAYVAIDKNRNRDLNDETVKKWILYSDKSGTKEAECTVQLCHLRDTIRVNDQIYTIDLAIRAMGGSKLIMQYRRGDALLGFIEYNGEKVKILLWDNACTNYRILSKIQILIDRNNDTTFDSREGRSEIFESLHRRIYFNRTSFHIDSILDNGLKLLCSSQNKTNMNTFHNAGIGDLISNDTVHYVHSLSLWEEFTSNDLVVLYFFEGSSFFAMNDIRIGALNKILQENFKSVRMIGVNRRVNGKRCVTFPVIEENLGWNGDLVDKFHNHRNNELIVVDNNARILCRGKPDRNIVESIFSHLKPEVTYSALYSFDQYMKK